MSRLLAACRCRKTSICVLHQKTYQKRPGVPKGICSWWHVLVAMPWAMDGYGQSFQSQQINVSQGAAKQLVVRSADTQESIRSREQFAVEFEAFRNVVRQHPEVSIDSRGVLVGVWSRKGWPQELQPRFKPNSLIFHLKWFKEWPQELQAGFTWNSIIF